MFAEVRVFATVLARYVLPDAQKDEAETIEYSLHLLFGPVSES